MCETWLAQDKSERMMSQSIARSELRNDTHVMSNELQSDIQLAKKTPTVNLRVVGKYNTLGT
jgi:hypothetical protein